MSGTSSWIIGGDPGCDLVLDRPSVSRHHCRLTLRPDGSYTLEDLGSTNGTFVNGQRISAPTPVARRDAITLGHSVPFVWPASPQAAPTATFEPPPPGGRTVRVGRDADNDLVIDSLEVSGRHARVVVSADGGTAVVEDLGSTNGVSINGPANRVEKVTIAPGDVVFFGPVAVPAYRFLTGSGVGNAAEDVGPSLVFRGAVMTVGRDPGCDLVVDLPMVSGRHARFVRGGKTLMIEDLGSSNGTFVNGRRVAGTAAVVPGDLIGLGSYSARLVDGPASAPDSGTATEKIAPEPDHGPTPAPVAVAAAWAAGLGAQAVALGALIALSGVTLPGALFGLALASVWLGMSAAFFAGRVLPRADTGGPRFADLAAGLGRSAALDLALVAVLATVVGSRVPLGDHRLLTVVVLLLTAVVGSALGEALLRLAPTAAAAAGAAAGLALLMAVSGGPSRPLPALSGPEQLVASVLPTRWSFEALLLLAQGAHTDDPAADPIEPFFPAETDRSGLPACATALAAMLGGLVYADALLISRPRPAAPGPR